MSYEQVTQTSRPYSYGEGKEFPNEQTAMKAIEKLKQEKNTELALLKLYDITTTVISHEGNTFYLKIVFDIPAIF